jgi:hypothetical protein
LSTPGLPGEEIAIARIGLLYTFDNCYAFTQRLPGRQERPRIRRDVNNRRSEAAHAT